MVGEFFSRSRQPNLNHHFTPQDYGRPMPKRVLTLADTIHNRKTSQSRQCYGRSYATPTPTTTTLQQLGLTLTKASALDIDTLQRSNFVTTLTPLHTRAILILPILFPGRYHVPRPKSRSKKKARYSILACLCKLFARFYSEH